MSLPKPICGHRWDSGKGQNIDAILGREFWWSLLEGLMMVRELLRELIQQMFQKLAQELIQELAQGLAQELFQKLVQEPIL